MRIQITAALLLALGATVAATAAPTSMLGSMPGRTPVAAPAGPQAVAPQAAPAPSKGLPWLTKWFSKPSLPSFGGSSSVEAAPSTPPAMAYQPAQPRLGQGAATPRATPGVPSAPSQGAPVANEIAAAEARAFRDLGHAEDRNGNLRQAEALYRQAMAADPTSAASVNDLGLCLARQGRLDQSVATFGQAIAMRPDKALYRNNIATVLVELGRPDEALAHLSSSYPVAVAQHNLGQLLSRAGRTTEAADRFRQALAMDPDLGPAREALSRLTQVATPAEAYAAAATPPAEAPAESAPADGAAVAEPAYASAPGPESASGGYPFYAAPARPAPRVAAAPSRPSAPSYEPTPAYETAVAPSYEEAAESEEEPTGVPSFPRLLPPVLDR